MFPLRDTIPSRRVPIVMWLLVLANAAAFVYELGLSEGSLVRVFERFGVVPAQLSLEPGEILARPESFLPLVTSMFLHGGWVHVLGNLWTLAIFGDNVEDRMGRLRFLVFYLFCGIVAGLTHVWFQPESSVPTVGASGAIAGVMGAYLVLFPRARVITLILLIFYPVFVELPAFVFLLLWFLSQVLSGTVALVTPEHGGGIAFQAHVGGFVAGFALHWLFLRRERA